MNKKIKNLTLASMCLALGVILPQAFHAVANAGSIFLPMHIPVLVCGFICGPFYGFIVGLLTPFISHIIFSMPPSAILPQMLVELASYGLFVGILNNIIKINNELIKNYIVLISAMLIGRIIYGLFNGFIYMANTYSLSIWLMAAFVTALPGIIIQLLIIPILIKSLNKIIQK